MNIKKMTEVFEEAANKKGYFFDKDDLGMYEDMFLREAWEIFGCLDFEKICEALGDNKNN